jgi:hypothetical protein
MAVLENPAMSPGLLIAAATVLTAFGSLMSAENVPLWML